MKKRVLFAIDSLGCGGAEKSLVELLPRLDYSRMDVDLYIYRHGGINDKHVPPQVRLVDFRTGRIASVCGNLLFAASRRLLSLAGLRRHPAETLWRSSGFLLQAPRQHYDVAIAYQQGRATFFVADKVSASKKIAWINVNLQAAGYRPAYCRPFYDRLDAVVAVSRMLAEKISEQGFANPQKLHTVYDIVSPESIRSMAAQGHQPKPLPADTLRLVTVGRMTPQKNYPLAVETAAILKRRGLRFVWHFIGDGIAAADVRALVRQHGLEDCIRMHGTLANPYPYFAAADIYVQTSAFEGFGLTLTEARLLGRPVVSTDFDVARDQIRDGVNGLLAEMSPEAVADRILLLASDSGLRRTIAAAAAAETNSTARTESEKVNRLILDA